MRLEEHMEESIRLFGKPYEEVHRWLDEFARSKEYGMRHRKVRHHLEGLRQASNSSSGRKPSLWPGSTSSLT